MPGVRLLQLGQTPVRMRLFNRRIIYYLQLQNREAPWFLTPLINGMDMTGFPLSFVTEGPYGMPGHGAATAEWTGLVN